MLEITGTLEFEIIKVMNPGIWNHKNHKSRDLNPGIGVMVWIESRDLVGRDGDGIGIWTLGIGTGSGFQFLGRDRDRDRDIQVKKIFGISLQQP